MISGTHLAAFICSVSFLHGILFAIAMPTDSSLAERAPLVKDLGPQKQPYTLNAFSGGRFSKTFEVVGGYNTDDIEDELYYGEDGMVPAIVKVVSSRNPTKNEGEVNNLKKLTLLLWSGPDAKSPFTMMVMKDVRKDYPVQGYSMKLLHQWYQRERTMDIMQNLETSRNTVRRTLMNFAMVEEIYLRHYDSHMGNFFMTDDFSQGMPIDWAPPDDGMKLSGVMAVNPEAANDDILSFSKWLDDDLMFSFSLQALEDQLQAVGEQLSPEHAALLPEENRRLAIERARIVAEQNAGQ